MSEDAAASLKLQLIAPSLTVDDVSKSLEWYTDILGFAVDERWEHEGQLMGAQLASGDTRLMIGQDDWAKGKKRSKGEGLRLYLVTTESVDDIAVRIRDNGGKLESGPEDMPWGGRALTVIDPTGFKITIASE